MKNDTMRKASKLFPCQLKLKPSMIRTKIKTNWKLERKTNQKTKINILSCYYHWLQLCSFIYILLEKWQLPIKIRSSISQQPDLYKYLSKVFHQIFQYWMCEIGFLTERDTLLGLWNFKLRQKKFSTKITLNTWNGKKKKKKAEKR